MTQRERTPLGPCPDNCGKMMYDLGTHRGFRLFQKPYLKGWQIYAIRMHETDELDEVLLPGTICDDTERTGNPSLKEVEENVIGAINDFWLKKQGITLSAQANLFFLDVIPEEEKAKQDPFKTVLSLIPPSTGGCLDKHIIIRKAKALGIPVSETEKIIRKLLREGTIYELKENCYKKTV
jgi:hypothetical protein